jgi:hypothetical protein
MNQTNDGGPAFPHLRRHVGPNTYEPLAEGGMSLRDWFAGNIIQGMFANPSLLNREGSFQAVNFSTAFQAADAMLAARKEEVSK